MKKIFVIIFLLSGAFTAKATHLVGGFMNYRYIGATGSGGVRYEVTLTVYRDCKSTVEFDESINVCVYRKDNSQFYNSFEFKRSQPQRVQPVGRTDCPEVAQSCLERTIYSRFIDLPKSNFGYYVQWQRCCRNIQVNLPNSGSGDPFQGQTYQCFIPSTAIKNNSPYFTEVPVPFMCINDLTEMRNTATDPDGDELVYKLVWPWQGGNSSDPMPDCSGTFNPPDNVIYTSGYSSLFPFGSGGVANINSQNGLTQYKAIQTGNYAVAIEVEEYRNGVLLSTIRLDLQILVINCQPNNKPVISNSTQLSYTITEGEKICFDITGTDKDAKNILTLKAYGDILSGNNGYTGPRATFSTAVSNSPVTSQLCWTTNCNLSRTEPYLITAEVVDDGCPSKFTNVNIEFFVKPFKSNISIQGPVTVCQYAKNVPYTISGGQPGSTYEWTINGGSLVTSTNTINGNVNWDNQNSGSVSVVEVSRFGCKSPPVTLGITLKTAPSKPFIMPVDTVCEREQKDYSITPTAGYTYKWFVKNGTILGPANQNKVTIIWQLEGKASLKIVQINTTGCPGDTGIVDVFISKPVTGKITGPTSVCPNVRNIDYTVTSTPGSSYKWFIKGGVQVAGGNSSNIQVNWGNKTKGYVKVIELNKFGCPGDTSTLQVLVDYVLIAELPKGDTSVCEFTKNSVYRVNFTRHSVYNWTVSGGTITSGQNTNIITVDWGGAGNGTVNMYETSYDSINNLPCISNVNTLNVFIRPTPNAKFIEGDFEVCQSGLSGTYKVTGFPNSKYAWSVNNNTKLIGQGTSTITYPYSSFGTFKFKVIETSEYGCPGLPIDTVLIIHPKPVTTPISGDTIVCYPNFNGHTYSVIGLPGSTFEWFVDGGIPVAPSTTNSITIDWSGRSYNTIKVLETSDFGCPGDTVRANVFFDRPSIDLTVVTVNPPPLNDNGIDVTWKTINAPRYNKKFYIEKRNAGTNDGWTQVGEVNGTAATYNEKDINTDITAFEYRVKGFDLCNQPIYTEIHTDILLTGRKKNGYETEMEFTPYIGWKDGVFKYDIYRKLPGKTSYELYEANVTDFTAFYENGLEYYTQCYRVKATELNGENAVSWSNEICFDFDPVIYLPNAFTRNDDNVNDVFVVRGGALRTVQVLIFNRWGEKLKELNSINDTWDGQYKESEVADGVYMYVCNYTGYDGRLYTTKGTITILR
ncbi:MAG: gliding motility-associated C-terminal domain-containing protein [Bacteroidia bacterium]|nr:gliding motility-associated C-terminal domain-containing protein [Bacteroidia bacterium]